MTTQQDNRTIPLSELDLIMRNTDPNYTNVNPFLRNRLNNFCNGYDEEGKEVLSIQSKIDLIDFLTRDIRLSNLSEWNNELVVVRFYLELGGDLILDQYPNSFLTCIKNGAVIMETSQGKGGFFRKIANTLRQENISETREPPKKSLFGGKKQDSTSY